MLLLHVLGTVRPCWRRCTPVLGMVRPRMPRLPPPPPRVLLPTRAHLLVLLSSLMPMRPRLLPTVTASSRAEARAPWRRLWRAWGVEETWAGRPQGSGGGMPADIAAPPLAGGTKPNTAGSAAQQQQLMMEGGWLPPPSVATTASDTAFFRRA